MTGITLPGGGLAELTQAVLGHEACAACGACVGLCPYIQCVDDRVAAVADCRKTEGRCFLFCPRAHPPEEPPAGHVPGELEKELGSFRRILQARALSGTLRRGAQHGGVATALLVQALRQGLIQAAVLTRSQGGHPETFIARTEEEVRSAGGSTFAVAPTVAAVNRAAADPELEGVPLGVVALPCQAAALSRIRRVAAWPDALQLGAAPAPGQSRPEWPTHPFPSLALIVGLFCTWALSQEGWLQILRTAGREGAEPAALLRAEIPPPPADVLELHLAGGVIREVPLHDVRPHIRPGCRLCADMTSESADVAVGLVEGREGWNTVITRTETGDTLVQAAEQSALLQTEPLDPERAAHLAGASSGKKRRAHDTAKERGLSLPYLSAPAGQRGEHD